LPAPRLNKVKADCGTMRNYAVFSREILQKNPHADSHGDGRVVKIHFPKRGEVPDEKRAFPLIPKLQSITFESRRRVQDP
jgi:hypothetical protein